MLNFLNLQKVVTEDRWQRFELLYEPLKGGDNDSWWIRAKEKEVRLLFLVSLYAAFIELFSINREKISK